MVYKSLMEAKRSEPCNKWPRTSGRRWGNAEVLVRIYEIQQSDNELAEAITLATNSQNPVDLRDLRANDPRQKALGASISGLGYGYRAKREERPVSSNEFTSAVVAEAVLAIWRHRPHQARFSSREHFGALYDRIFTSDLNGAQAVGCKRYCTGMRKSTASDRRGMRPIFFPTVPASLPC